jgi:hypothetical protein
MNPYGKHEIGIQLHKSEEKFKIVFIKTNKGREILRVGVNMIIEAHD